MNLRAAALLLYLACTACVAAEVRAVALHERIAAICPITGVSIGDPADKRTWRVDFGPGSTPQQRADAAAVITAWTDDDWKGTAAQVRSGNLSVIVQLQSDIRGLTAERDYWQTQGAAARVSALQSLINQAQIKIDVLRPQS